MIFWFHKFSTEKFSTDRQTNICSYRSSLPELKKNKKEKITLFIVATNVIASRLPEHRPTGTSHAPTKNVVPFKLIQSSLFMTSKKTWLNRFINMLIGSWWNSLPSKFMILTSSTMNKWEHTNFQVWQQGMEIHYTIGEAT